MIRDVIFITGATGRIGSQVAATALQAGYSIRISVRREKQVEESKMRLAPYFTGPDQLDIVVIPDLTDVAAVRAALDGVSYIIHVASPLPGGGGDSDLQKDFVGPAVGATEAMLKAADGNEAIKTLVIMSSIVSHVPLGADMEGYYFVGKQVSVSADHLDNASNGLVQMNFDFVHIAQR
jgi:nucleoside-diphosphate-sugar epimerase